jgi:hypothetical protein
MKINLLANRTLRDLSLYPIFPWLTKENEIFENKSNEINENLLNKDNILNKNSETKIEKSKLQNFQNYFKNIKSKLRPLDIPMGLLELNEKSKKRKLNYINLFQILIEQINKEPKNNIHFNYINHSEQNIPIYDNDISLLYKNPNISFDKIPYMYGSHFSNILYVSYYLIRIFPFTNISIEIKGDSFDIPDKLFINFYKSFINSTIHRSDIREIIPQFFYLPEMFININKLNQYG